MNQSNDPSSPAVKVKPRRRRLRKPRRGPFIAVDFDSRLLHMARAEHVAGGTRIDQLAREPLPEGLTIDDPEAMGRFLGSALRKHRMRGRGVIMNVRRGQVVLKPLVLPQPDEDSELAAMVQYQLGKELSIEPQEAVIDYAIESHDVPVEGEEAPGGVEILAAAVKQPIVDYYRKVAEVAGVRLLRLGLRPYANTRAVDACGLAGDAESVGLIHVTADETEVDVIAGQTLAFSRSAVIRIHPHAPAGEQPASDDSALQGKAANRVPAENGAASSLLGGDPLSRAPVEAIASEAARSLQSFHAVQRSRRIERILIAGDSGIETRLADKLALRLRVPCVLYEPGDAVAARKLPDRSGGFISAIGLAVGDREQHFAPIDFSNPKRPKVRRDTQKLRRALAAAAVALLGAMLIVSAMNEHRAGRAELADLRQQIAQQRQPLRESAQQQSRLATVQGWVGDRRPWADVLAHLSSLFPPAQEAYISSIQARADGRIEFTLNARDTGTYDRLAAALREAGYSVSPRRSRGRDDAYGYGYEVNVMVMPDRTGRLDLADLEPVQRRDNDLYRAGHEDEVVRFYERRRGGRGSRGGSQQ